MENSGIFFMHLTLNEGTLFVCKLSKWKRPVIKISLFLIVGHWSNQPDHI